MNKKILVMAGTPVDTEAGYKLLKNNFSDEIEIIERAISRDPNQQTYFQTMDMDKREKIIKEILSDYKTSGVDIFFIYCNSLSASVDFDSLAQILQINIITPFTLYRELASNYNKIGVLAANTQGAAGVERVMSQTNEDISITSISNLEWVYAVERHENPKVIVDSYGLPASIELFKANNVEKIVFACTHFPYFFNEYQKKTDIFCLNVDGLMVEKVVNLLK